MFRATAGFGLGRSLVPLNMQHRMFMPFLLLFFFFFVLARRRGERQCCVAAGVADKAPCNETGDPK